MGFQCGVVVLSILLVSMASAQDLSADPALKAAASGVNRFAFGLLKAAVKDRASDQNILISPLSASLATAMVYEAAKGDTRSQIQTSLSYPEDSVFAQGFAALNSNLNNVSGVTLEVANRVYMEKTFAVKDSYKDALTKTHKSSLASVDFKTQAEASRKEINKWVLDKTHNKIEDLLGEGTLDANTVMVLVNALYFKGLWKEKFNANNTETAPFHVTKERTVNVSMMYQSGHMSYAEIPELAAKAVSLPYEGGSVKMVIILPDEIDGLPAVLDKLTSGAYSIENISYFQPEVRLWLPKFKLEDKHDLKAIYQKMGITKMFESSADLSGAADPPPPLAVSAAVQKTFMEVNEEGTEAAAATGTVVNRLMMAKPVQLKVDRPFILNLLETKSNSAVVAAVVTSPSLESKAKAV